MSKRIIYTDEFGNKVDVNSIEEIHVIFDDIFATCEENHSCLCAKENIKACIEKCYNDRVKELKTNEHQNKSIG